MGKNAKRRGRECVRSEEKCASGNLSYSRHRALYGGDAWYKDLTCGYLFRPITPDLGIKDAPFTSSAAESRLKGYLKEMNADNGETLHGFRSGCAITLALTGADLAEIMDHVGWTRRHTALYYL